LNVYVKLEKYQTVLKVVFKIIMKMLSAW